MEARVALTLRCPILREDTTSIQSVRQGTTDLVYLCASIAIDLLLLHLPMFSIIPLPRIIPGLVARRKRKEKERKRRRTHERLRTLASSGGLRHHESQVDSFYILRR